MLAWFRNLGGITQLATAVGLFTGAVIGVAQAWPVIEWAVPAHRGYVLHEVSGLKVPLNEVLIWKFEDARNRYRNEENDWAIKLRKEDDEQTKGMIEKQIKELQRLQKIETQKIDKLSQ